MRTDGAGRCGAPPRPGARDLPARADDPVVGAPNRSIRSPDSV